jgi:hypothetical protein
MFTRPLSSGLGCDFSVPFFALVGYVTPDRSCVSDAVVVLLAFAAACAGGPASSRGFSSIPRFAL